MECKVSEKMSSSESVIFFANLANIPHIKQNNSTLFQIFGKSFGKIPKGQLISKCPFGAKTSSKKPTKFFPGFLP